MFVVDDFGRQRIRPRDLLNRWIVPLESRVDYLTLHTGKKFEMPFDVLIVFATNLNPESLADEAFLRRIPYKIYAKNPTTEEFARIFELNCTPQGARLRPGHHRVPAAPLLRAARARDARLPSARPGRAGGRHLPVSEGRKPVITRELLDQACTNYFLEAAGRAQSAAGTAATRQVRVGQDAEGRSARETVEASPEPGNNLRRAPAATACRRGATWLGLQELAHEFGARASIAPCSCPRDTHRRGVRRTGHVTGLLLLVSELLVVVLTAVRRPAAIVDRAWHARAGRGGFNRRCS